MTDPTDPLKPAALKTLELGDLKRQWDLGALSQLPAALAPILQDLQNSGAITHTALQTSRLLSDALSTMRMADIALANTIPRGLFADQIPSAGSLILREMEIQSGLRSALNGIGAAMARTNISEFLRPELSLLQRAASFGASSVLAPDAFHDEVRWRTELQDRMSGVSSAWMFARSPDFSGFAFANLARFAEDMAAADPFSEETNALVLSELGEPIEEVGEAETTEEREDRFDAAGRNTALVAFPEEHYPSIVVAAGFRIDYEQPPLPVALENGDDTVAFDPFHNFFVVSLETHMRNFVSQTLHAHAGPKWMKQRVPPDRLDKWKEGQDEQRTRGRPVYDLIHYANFMDLHDVIVRGDNWREVFGVIFGAQDGFRVSMQRMHTLRNDVAHGRPRSATDVLTLATEGPRLLKAMGVGVQTSFSHK